MPVSEDYLDHNKRQESQQIQPNLIDSGICNTMCAIWNLLSGSQKIVTIKSKQAGRPEHQQINKPMVNKKSGRRNGWWGELGTSGTATHPEVLLYLKGRKALITSRYLTGLHFFLS